MLPPFDFDFSIDLFYNKIKYLYIYKNHKFSFMDGDRMFRNMEYVYEVYKEKSFTRAAKNLYVTQPCLSALVKKTEQKLGFPIFNRNTSPLQLTECGAEYIRYIERMMALENEFENYLNDVCGLKTGHLSIGSNNAFSALVLPQIISEFNRLYPGVDVKLSEGNISYLEEKLFKGDLDLVLDNHPMDESIYLRELFCSEQLLLAVPASDPVCARHPLCALTHEDILKGKHTCIQTPAISMDSFCSHTFIALRHGNDTRIQLDFLCEEAGFSPKIQLEVDQLTTAYNIVCNNIGITLVSDTLVTRTPPVSNLVYFKIDSNHTRRFAYFYYKNASYVTLAMREFIKLGIENIQHNTKEDSTH